MYSLGMDQEGPRHVGV